MVIDLMDHLVWSSVWGERRILWKYFLVCVNESINCISRFQDEIDSQHHRLMVHLFHRSLVRSFVDCVHDDSFCIRYITPLFKWVVKKNALHIQRKGIFLWPTWIKHKTLNSLKWISFILIFFPFLSSRPRLFMFVLAKSLPFHQCQSQRKCRHNRKKNTHTQTQ